MADLATATVVATLSKLISMGIASHKAMKNDDFDEADVSALKTLLDTGSGIIQAWRRGPDTRPGALHLALITRAFGVALARYWRSPEMLAKKDIEHCLGQAALKIRDPNARPVNDDVLLLIQRLSGHPLGNPYYRALWDAFTHPVVGPNGGAPASPLGESPREFERHFRSAYIEALATPEGEKVRRWCLGLVEEKSEVMRHMLAEDMAAWGRRHVFGNIVRRQSNDSIPFMTIDDSYVEPWGDGYVFQRRTASGAAPAGSGGERPIEKSGPILQAIRKCLPNHRLIVVTADFGHGKSLTARRLARDVAVGWLDSARPAPENTFPVFIKCARDIRSPRYAHEDVVRRALWNAAIEVTGSQLAMSDNAFRPLEGGMAALYIFDGLDEVSLGRNDLEDLFRTLYESLGEQQRAIVFTRPGALSSERALPDQTAVIELLPFDDDQVAVWAERWNQLSPQSQLDVTKLGELADLAHTPILLLMIAMTGDAYPDLHGNTNRTMLYERFFLHIARGKHASDTDEHQPIQDASDSLAKKLQALGILDSEDPVEAMLWLMSRVAWEDYALERNEHGKRLQSRHIEHLLADELELNHQTHLTLVQMGLLLALQMDPSGGSSTILFGHQSFREFLVARYWKHQVCLIISRKSQRHLQTQAEDRLMKARLPIAEWEEDKTFDLLVEMLGNLDGPTRHSVRGWAQDYVDGDELHLTYRPKHEERRMFLRESALAIGSALEPSQGLELRNEWALRSLWIGFLFYEQSPIIRAPRLQNPQCRLMNADFSDAYLPHANLEAADCVQINFEGADLSGANLSGARLFQANLSHTTLSGAKLIRAKLSHARLIGADLSGADLSGADLSGADLSGADLSGADLSGADLSGASLQKAKLHRANLNEAIVARKDLRKAQLRGARGLDSIHAPPDDDNIPF